MIPIFCYGDSRLNRWSNHTGFNVLLQILWSLCDSSRMSIAKLEKKIWRMRCGSNRIKFFSHDCNRRSQSRFCRAAWGAYIHIKSGRRFVNISTNKHEFKQGNCALSCVLRCWRINRCVCFFSKFKRSLILLLQLEVWYLLKSIWLLECLPRGYSSVISVIESKFEPLPITKVEALLLAHEARLHKFDEVSD